MSNILKTRCKRSFWECMLFITLISLMVSCSTTLKPLSYMSSDNGDGTYTNPIIRADYPDPDIIRVGEDYYMVSSSFVAMPGIPICHSKDLVNWKIIGHAYDSLTFRPEYRMEGGMTAYSKICWAPSIKYYNGIYYIGVNIKDDGFVMFQSSQPQGPYKMYKYDKRLYDPGFFIDDDGKKYVTHGKGKIYITRLKDDATGVMDQDDEGTLIIDAPEAYHYLFEGCHTYKRNGWYYIFNPALGYDGVQMISRSRNLYGPYETKVLIKDDINYVGAGVHQGGYIDTQSGESWAYTFQDRDYLGRCVMLYPMRWVDDWPVVGPEGRPAKGVVTYKKPDTRQQPLSYPQMSDDFSSRKLNEVWEFNHVPNPERWSLTDHKGYLRLYASPAKGFEWARNSLTQKISGMYSKGTAVLDVSGLQEGDFAGNGILGNVIYQLGIRKKNSEYQIELREGNRDGETVTDSLLLAIKEKVWLRTEVTKDGSLKFYYSTDGKEFLRIGREGISNFWGFLGIRHALCCYNVNGVQSSGYADFDAFIISDGQRGNHYNARNDIDFSMYDDKCDVTFLRPVKKRPMQHIISVKDKGWLQFNNLESVSKAHQMIITGRCLESPLHIEIRRGSVDGDILGIFTIPVGDKLTEHRYNLPSQMPSHSKVFFVFMSDHPSLELKCFRFE